MSVQKVSWLQFLTAKKGYEKQVKLIVYKSQIYK